MHIYHSTYFVLIVDCVCYLLFILVIHVMFGLLPLLVYFIFVALDSLAILITVY